MYNGKRGAVRDVGKIKAPKFGLIINKAGVTDGNGNGVKFGSRN